MSNSTCTQERPPPACSSRTAPTVAKKGLWLLRPLPPAGSTSTAEAGASLTSSTSYAARKSADRLAPPCTQGHGLREGQTGGRAGSRWVRTSQRCCAMELAIPFQRPAPPLCTALGPSAHALPTLDTSGDASSAPNRRPHHPSKSASKGARERERRVPHLPALFPTADD